ncbi:cytochrome ubiquinol oxidase subunit I [Microlunatus parietis]|uniref:Cytochrome d ubiquinol oxidase subunit I n=1 Tax=Microlunatus parietis TaxID=682979 RepID=A0A7Y9I9R3_9ACTN|nr:cytochrome ubiquinol oxidase subunit I [Microlunatus parietis]NYE72394.1 cytochrome d ubiquinol oxidase subunit I [Microlunatus parietis]
MDALTLARWQFGITTVYHFFFVPLTIGLSGLVAVLQTIWHRTGNEAFLKLTKFFGKLFLINFALGIVTGIVQEFQFGMNWSSYSRFVGDIFGAPLALEGLLAFFLESTFLGLWIFGWDRLPKRIHLACIWIASIGTVFSAYFILAANSFMQNPVGFTYNPVTDRAELTDFVAVLTNPVVLVTFPHQIFACYLVAGAFLAAVAGWHLWRKPNGDDHRAFRTALRIGAAVMIIAGAGVAVSGDAQSKVMVEVQPMKMAAAEALYETEAPASFSILTIGTLDGQHELFSIRIPYLLSFLSTGDPEGEVKGIRELQRTYEETYGPGSYAPIIPTTYWTFRLMIGLGMASVGLGALLLWVTRGERVPRARFWGPVLVALPLLPLFGNSFGWIFTETGRQPWLVFGLLPTAAGVSPGTTLAEVAISLTTFTLIYSALAVIEARLLLTYIRAGLPDVTPPVAKDGEETPLTFAY